MINTSSLKHKFTLKRKLKSSHRKFTYGIIFVRILRTKVITEKMIVEHLYRGSTPYPIKKLPLKSKKFTKRSHAVRYLNKLLLSNKKLKYKVCREH